MVRRHIDRIDPEFLAAAALGEARCRLAQLTNGEAGAELFASIDAVAHTSQELSRIYRRKGKATGEMADYAATLFRLGGSGLATFAAEAAQLARRIDDASVFPLLDAHRGPLLDVVGALDVDEVLTEFRSASVPPPEDEIRQLFALFREHHAEIRGAASYHDPLAASFVALNDYGAAVYGQGVVFAGIKDKLEAFLNLLIVLGALALCIKVLKWILFRKRMSTKGGLFEVLVFFLLCFLVYVLIQKVIEAFKKVLDP